MKYLLIDGNNLAVRNAFANDQLTNSEGLSTGAQFGMFQSLNSLKRKFPDSQFLLVWDSKSNRRIIESTLAVQEAIIPETYKANRKKAEMPKPLADFYAHQEYLQKGIGTLGIPQIKMSGFEADDVIASYANLLKKDHEVIVVTSDKDYYQILDTNVSIWDGMKNEMITKEKFTETFGISPEQWVDVGAMMGDDGDNIFGVPGWGDKTALKEVIKYGSWKGIYDAYDKQFSHLRKEYPDLDKIEAFDVVKLKRTVGMTAGQIFMELATMKSDPEKPTSKIKYPGIYLGMPYSGVLAAYESGIVKMPKTTIMALIFKARVELAASLKKMDSDIQDLPKIEDGNTSFDADRLKEFLEYYEMYSLTETFLLFGGVSVDMGGMVSQPKETEKEELQFED